MPTEITFRRGTNAQRVGVVLANGEPAWTTDTKRLYIGDGTTSGGVFIGGADTIVDSLNGLSDVVLISGQGNVTITENKASVQTTMSSYMLDSMIIGGIKKKERAAATAKANAAKKKIKEQSEE